nr:olfactory receptor 14C36-like [Pelodiscus sinensis]|eukprot:XP_025037794.1 olfactory receptor 14C36-like [Pelodiscus sinensis]
MRKYSKGSRNQLLDNPGTLFTDRHRLGASRNARHKLKYLANHQKLKHVQPPHCELREEMSNRSTVTEFLLLGFSDVRELQILHFVLFLVLYLATLVGNLLIISAIILDHPFLAANFVLLTVMAYDRYVAICHPLHYERVMNRRACVNMAASAWITGIVYSALHSGNTFRLPFCQSNSNVINQFFCEIPQLLKLACSDSYLSEVGLLAISLSLVFICFVLMIVSYVQILKAVLRIPSEQGRHKAFSTCLPHLAVVSLSIFTSMSNYLKSTPSSGSTLDLMVGVFYAVVPPMMNPVIYSLRNKELKAALKKLVVWRLFTNN